MKFSKVAFLFLAGVFLVGCAAPKTVQEAAATANFGPAPTNADQLVRGYFTNTLIDPASLQIQSISQPYKGYAFDPAYIPKGQNFGWGVNAIINAKDKMGNFLGLKKYALFIRNGTVLNAFEVVAPQTAGNFIQPIQQ